MEEVPPSRKSRAAIPLRVAYHHEDGPLEDVVTINKVDDEVSPEDVVTDTPSQTVENVKLAAKPEAVAQSKISSFFVKKD